MGFDLIFCPNITICFKAAKEDYKLPTRTLPLTSHAIQWLISEFHTLANLLLNQIPQVLHQQ